MSGSSAGWARRLAERAYERERERDADAFAFDALCRQGLDPSVFATAIEALGRDALGTEQEPWAFLNTHPSPSDRAARARAWRCESGRR